VSLKYTAPAATARTRNAIGPSATKFAFAGISRIGKVTRRNKENNEKNRKNPEPAGTSRHINRRHRYTAIANPKILSYNCNGWTGTVEPGKTTPQGKTVSVPRQHPVKKQPIFLIPIAKANQIDVTSNQNKVLRFRKWVIKPTDTATPKNPPNMIEPSPSR